MEEDRVLEEIKRGQKDLQHLEEVIRSLAKDFLQYDKQTKEILVCSEKILESVKDMKTIQEAHNDLITRTLEIQFVTQTQIKALTELMSASAQARESFYQKEITQQQGNRTKARQEDSQYLHDERVKWIAIASALVAGFVSISILVLEHIL